MVQYPIPLHIKGTTRYLSSPAFLDIVVRMTEQSLMARELGLDPSAQPVEMLLNPLKATVGQIGGTVETARSGKSVQVERRSHRNGERLPSGDGNGRG